MMDHGQAEHPSGMTAQIAPVGGDQEKAFAGQGGKQPDYAEVPNLRRTHICNASSTLRQKQRQQHAQRGHRAIRRDKQRADVKENWMHLSQDTASGHQKGRIRPTGP